MIDRIFLFHRNPKGSSFNWSSFPWTCHCPQIYHCYPGRMEVLEIDECKEGCSYSQLTATAVDLSGNCRAKLKK